MTEQDKQNLITSTSDPIAQTAAEATPIVEEKSKKKLSKGEKRKLRVINKLIEGEINGTEAAKKLGITTRQVRNLKRQVLTEGRDGVIHKNKNYKPYNTYDSEISTFVCKLYRKEYRGTNFSEFARIIQEEHGIEASRSTIYNFLRRGRIRSPQRKQKKRKSITGAVGELVKVEPTKKVAEKKKQEMLSKETLTKL